MTNELILEHVNQEMIIDLGDVQVAIQDINDDSRNELVFRVIQDGQELAWDDPVVKNVSGYIQLIALLASKMMNDRRRDGNDKVTLWFKALMRPIFVACSGTLGRAPS